MTVLAEIVDEIIDRAKRNALSGLPLNAGADPDATCVRLGVEIDASSVPDPVCIREELISLGLYEVIPGRVHSGPRARAM